MILRPEDVEDLQLVGSGGFGSVYRGWSKKLSMKIAVKMIDGSHGDNMKSLMKEKDMMSRANYTYVLRLLGLYETGGTTLCKYGLVMEYMPYGSVCTLFDHVKDVPWALRFQILHQVALGMNYLHHILEPPIIHRDLKRQNVLLNKSLDVQLTDFGLAKNEASVSSSQSMAGTLSHMPPEALQPFAYKPTKKFDVYSYGILTWSVLSTHEPYENINGDTIKMLILQRQNPRPDMNLVNQWICQKMVPETIQLMQECWDSDPAKRPRFSAIIDQTNEMNEAYAGEIDCEVFKVLDLLKKHNSSHCQSLYKTNCWTRPDPKPSVPESSSFNLSNFRAMLQQADGKGADLAETPAVLEDCSVSMASIEEHSSQEMEESCSADKEPKNEAREVNTLPSDSSEDSDDDDDDDKSPADFLMNNIVTFIQRTGEYKKIMNKLDDNGILSKVEQNQLQSSQNLKDLGNKAGKFILTKSKKNPEAMLGLFKKLL